MNLTVDASVFVAASRAGEANYLASRQFLQQVRAQGCDVFCPTLVLPECAAAIARPTADADLADELVSLIEAFPGLVLLPLDLQLAHRAAQMARSHRLRGADSVYAAVAEACDATLIAWDTDLLDRSTSCVTTLTPAQWLAEHTVNETDQQESPPHTD